ncbi:MAG: NAD(P)-dependent oxidoreductase [Rhodobacteraceae bacterium]|jgi:uronate dehydrogenase|nr:NAD(P)-dependent oxidoreductase [Paracoccaceae bacterium]
MSRLLVTGAAGGLGRGLRPHLRRHWRLRLTDVVPPGPIDPQDEVVTGDLCDPAIAARAVAGCDAVLHLAAVHGLTITFSETLDVNYTGTLHLMDAAVAAGVRRVVFASSNHGWGFHPRANAPLPDDAPPRPDGWYAVSKLWGEAVMALYADMHGMTNTSLRIGYCGADVPDERRRQMWLSFRDLAALVTLSLTRPGPGHAAFFAAADCNAPAFAGETARRLGFVPQDRPDDHLAHPGIAAEPPPPGLAGEAMGGAFAAANFRADPEAWRRS